MGLLGLKRMPDCSTMSCYCGRFTRVSIISPKLGNPHQPWGECGWCHRVVGLPRHDYLVQPTRTMHTIPSPGRRRNLIRTRLPTRLRRIARCFWHVAIDSGRHGPSVRQTQTLTHVAYLQLLHGSLGFRILTDVDLTTALLDQYSAFR
jgi:hypothetical protein